ncbi:MAG: hypothetical protein EHM36_01430 [Deltaproteobacteria bacterium]|nr:MAG: hypothetical protein EHM36_01430 [Deltaproteobacteria bacterium]
MPNIHRYSISRAKRLIDSEPMQRGEAPLVWSKDRHEWIEMDLVTGEHVDSVPVTDEEAQQICETGEIPERIIQYLKIDMSDGREVIQE